MNLSRARLTRREREIVQALLEGCTNGQMAARFGVREQTIKNQLSSLFAKVGVSTRLELALLAASEGLLAMEQPVAAVP
jgi:two-component system nitrate/nitrite response regulator NarL